MRGREGRGEKEGRGRHGFWGMDTPGKGEGEGEGELKKERGEPPMSEVR